MVNTPVTLLENPQLYGALFLVGGFQRTPLINLMGSISGGRTRQIGGLEYVEGVEWSLDAPSLSNLRSEQQSIVGPPDFTPTTRTQSTNTVSYFDYPVFVSEQAIAAQRWIDVTNTSSRVDLTQQDPGISLLQFEIQKQMLQIATDFEKLVLDGVYTKSTGKAVAPQTGGFVELLTADAYDVSAPIDRDKFEAGLKEMFDAGASMSNLILFVGARCKQILSKLYGYAPMDRNIGGVNIKQLEVDLVGNLPIVVLPKLSTKMIILNMDLPKPVVFPMPKGVLYFEELAKVGTAINGHIYGALGVDRGIAAEHKMYINCTV